MVGPWAFPNMEAVVDAIIDRLDTQSAKIDRLQSEIDQMKGGLTVLKALGALLGVGGIGTLLAYFQSQAGK